MQSAIGKKYRVQVNSYAHRIKGIIFKSLLEQLVFYDSYYHRQ